MSTLNIYEMFSIVTDEGDTYGGGSRTVAKTMTVDGYTYEGRNVLATALDVDVLWVAGDGGMDSFDFLYFEADKDCLLELEDGNSVSHVLQVNANVPLMLGHDDIDDTALGGSGLVASLIVNIEVEALSDATRVRLVLID